MSDEMRDDATQTEEIDDVTEVVNIDPAAEDVDGPEADTTDDEVTDDQVTDDQVTDDQVTDDQVTDDQVTDDQVTDDQVTDDEVTDDEVTDDEVTDDDSGEPTRRKRDFWRMKLTVKPVPVILILLLLISGATTAWLYFKQYRQDQQTGPSAEQAAVTAASDGTVALLSYSPETLDKDFANARSHLAGDFLSYYDQFTEQIVAPAARKKSLKTSAHVMRAAVSELQADSAVVLVFVDQSTTSKDNPDPSLAASSVLVTMAKIDGQWLITKFTPV
ncbi:hypothetical protein [Mycobacterium spongiae]|uniref:hypothetical protein n=1 Tax=Mycobacterium spongiae TaxID=886343 RepID=UPI003CCE875A